MGVSAQLGGRECGIAERLEVDIFRENHRATNAVTFLCKSQEKMTPCPLVAALTVWLAIAAD